MHLGIVTTSLSRNAGGLFHSVRRLAQQTLAAGADVSVFGTQDEHTQDDLPSWAPLEPRVFPTVGPRRLAASPELARALAQFPSSETLLHQHGIWQFPSRAVERWGRRTGQPVMISPRGMLDSWALANSRWRKRVVGVLFEYRNLRSAPCLHALADAEFQSMRAFGLKQPIAVVPNGIDLPRSTVGETDPPDDLPTSWQGARVLLFLSRLHPKKGLPALIEAWKDIDAGGQGWRLALAGPDEVGHHQELDQQITSSGLSNEIALVGPQYGAQKARWLSHADAFILPSFSEGFPMAVLEAMAYRLPVIMTKECNFPEALAAGVAIAARPTRESVREALTHLLDMSSEEADSMGDQAHRFIADGYTWEHVATKMMQVYQWMLGGGSPPDSVRA